MAIHLNRRNKYFLEIFTVFLIFSLGMFCIFTVFQYNREKVLKAEKLNAELQALNGEIMYGIRNGAPADSCVKSILGDNRFVRVTVVDSLGVVTYDSHTSRPDTMANHLDRVEIGEAMRDGYAHIIKRVSETENNPFFYSAMYKEGIVVRSSVPYGVKLRDFLRVDKLFFWFVLSQLLFMFAASFVVSLYLSRFASNKDEKEKQLLRKELTNNINHELKTPVGAAKAYLETIVNMPDLDADMVKEFVKKAYSQMERLTKLLNDISLITRLDDASQLFRREPVMLDEVIRDIKAYVDVLPPDKKMEIHSNIPEMTVVNGDPTLINSIFFNLTENALSYSGGTDIYISVLSMSSECIEISFSDNGIGVDEEHLDKIFQRFYRVDKGRSRKAGGTGLGLSIVKNAVNYHNGSICVRQRKGGGLEFLFTLKRN